MKKFIALFSQDQFFTYNDVSYKFNNGEFLTDSPELIEFLTNNTSCYLEKIEVKETPIKAKK